MRARHWLVLVLLLSAAVPAHPAGSDIACSVPVLNAAWELFRDAGLGNRPTEEAAFVIRGRDGELRFPRWSHTDQAYRVTFDGVAPPDAVAIIHTHPNGMPQPSRNDVALAAQTRLPVYVFTRTRVIRTDGSAVQTIWSGDWNPNTKHRRWPPRTLCRDSTLRLAQATPSE